MIERSLPLHFAHRKQLGDLAAQGRYRQLIAQEGIDFSSNDCLGLAVSPMK